jgi:hypothetical protein
MNRQWVMCSERTPHKAHKLGFQAQFGLAFRGDLINEWCGPERGFTAMEIPEILFNKTIEQCRELGAR